VESATDCAVAVCSRSFSRHEGLRHELLARYPRARFNSSGARLAGDELARFLDGAEKAIVALERIDGPLLARLPELRVISKFGVGLDGLSLDALAAGGVQLGWTGGVNRRAVAELVIAQCITWLRGLTDASRAVRQGGWSCRLALVPLIGRPRAAARRRGAQRPGTRTATVRRPAVSGAGTESPAGRTSVSGPGQKRRTIGSKPAGSGPAT